MELKQWLMRFLREQTRCVNCTLWNWNQVLWSVHHQHGTVLIVPYGIETRLRARSVSAMDSVNCTLWNWNVLEYLMNKVSWSVNCTLWNWNISNTCPCTSSSHVLIVPYGIETVVSWVQICQPQKGVNCTLWNWNLF